MLGKQIYVLHGLRVMKVELKLETLTRGVVQSAFDNFAKFTVKHLRWSIFLIKLLASLWASLSRKKTLAQAFSCKFSKIFKKTYFVEHVQTDVRMSEKNQNNCIQKIYLKENTGDAVLFSIVTDMWTYSFSKMCFITDAFLWKLRSLTEHQFYRTMLRDYLWYPVPFAMYHLFYQW